MKKWSANKNLIAIISLVVLVVVAAIGIGVGIIKSNQPKPNETVEKMNYTFYQSEPEFLDNHDDIGAMILDCDDESCFNGTLANASLTSREGEYVQGKGALKISSFVHKSTVVTSGYFLSADISEFAKGSIHVSLYISDTKYLGGNLIYELTSSGTFDKEEMAWNIPASVLESGWNELYLGIEDATITGGEPDLSKIKYFRMYGPGGSVGLDIIMDCVYATNTPGMSLEAKATGETASAKAGYLMDFDTLDGIKSSGTLLLSTAKGEYKEGEGAVIISNPKVVWVTANLKTTDLSAYKNGKLSFWVYINDASYVKDGAITVELSSSGTFDKNEISWRLEGAKLKTGWNEVILNMSEAANSSTDKIDLTKVNYLRIFGQKCDENLAVILDAMRVLPPTKLVPSDGMILNCDTQENMIVTPKDAVSLTTVTGEYKEGTGAFKNTGSGIVWWQVTMLDLVDVSKYKDGGIHLWLYVSDASKLDKAVNIELGSGGQCDVDEYQWVVTSLNSGWNELLLDFESAIVTGKPDLNNVNFLRVFGKRNADITVMLDDVRAIEPEKASTVPGMIANCDSTRKLKLGTASLTTKEGEYKEGTGAYITSKASNLRVSITLNNPVDVSEYADGRLHLWLYIDNPEKIYKGFLVELGNDAENFYRWIVAPGTLQSGWNELYLNFKDANLKLGETNFKEIDYFRLLQYSNADESVYQEMTTIVDDIRAVEAEEQVEKPVVPGMILDCDSKGNMTVQSNNNNSVTNTAGEFKEGTGAFKNEGKGTVWWAVTLNNPVDISAYDDGGIHVWLYVSDVSKLTSVVNIEVGSGGTYDKNEYQWFVDGLQPGWNELYLDLTDPDTVRDGEPDFSKINWFRVYASCSADIVAMVDDVRAVEAKESEGGNEEEKPVIPGMLANCDNTNGLTLQSGTGAITTTAGEFKEGTGAIKTTTNVSARAWINWNEPVDVEKYVTNGYLHFWFYIDDPAKITNLLIVDIGHDTNNMFRWTIKKGDLVSGWNDIYLPFASGSLVPAGAEVDFSEINMFRVSQSSGTLQTMTTYTDDVRVMETLPDQVLANCDNTNGLTLQSGTGAITTTAGEFKEGVGAIKTTTNVNARAWINWSEPVDIEKYVTNGYLHFWFYIDDPAKITNLLIVDIGHDTNNMFRWTIAKGDLVSGWNDIYLSFAKGKTAIGNVDFSEINMFRVSQSGGTLQTMTTYTDDVKVMETLPGQVLANCDNTNGLTLQSGTGAITTTAGEFKEGIGAIKTTTNVNARAWINWSEPVDIEKYVTNGYLHFWFYIDDPAKITNLLIVDIGHDTNNMFRWTIAKGNLVSGWNEILLPFAKGKTAIGNVDFSEINMFRVSQSGGTLQTMTTYTDDIRIVASE